MSQFLFVVEVPPSEGMSSEPMYSSAWQAFARESENTVKKIKDAKKIQLNAWLLPANGTWQAMVELSALANHYKLSYSALLVEGVVDLSAKNKKHFHLRTI